MVLSSEPAVAKCARVIKNTLKTSGFGSQKNSWKVSKNVPKVTDETVNLEHESAASCTGV